MAGDFDPLTFHAEAVRIPSHESVEGMRDVLVETLDDHGADPRVDDAGNTLATRTAGGAGGPHLVLNTHIDTVPPHVPFEEREAVPGSDGTVQGDIVCGRGACDAKGPLAAMLAAFLGADLPTGQVTLAVTPDEETHSTGATALDLDADAYVVGEPTDLDVCTAARGRFEGEIAISGIAAHAAEPASGANAIRAAAPVLQAMETFDEERGPGEHESLGRPTLTATRIAGGEAANQVPAECRITFDRRSVPPETADGFRAALEEHCYRWMPAAMDLRVALADRETPFLEAFATDPDALVVTTLQSAGGGQVRPFGAATEASYFASDAPTVVFGPGVLADEYGAVAHAAREYGDRRDLVRAGTVLREAVERFLG
jgi:acetylornithine deacetylase/succinyl-diaminopimelate desuccinylase-like protein